MLALALFIVIPAWPNLRGPDKRKPALRNDDPTVIELLVNRETLGKLTNTSAIMSVMQRGRHVRSHMCQFRGSLILRYADGAETDVPILPGHTNAAYEFVCTNGYFAVPRDSFLSALASAGVDTNKIPLR
jgi:hypothetical protein